MTKYWQLTSFISGFTSPLIFYRLCAYSGAVLRHAFVPTGPWNLESLFVDQILDPRIVEITLLQKGNQALPLKNPT